MIYSGALVTALKGLSVSSAATTEARKRVNNRKKYNIYLCYYSLLFVSPYGLEAQVIDLKSL